MKAIRIFRLSLLLVSLLLGFTGCAAQTDKLAAADAVRQQNLSGLPYHPLVYHLDLSILAYQLYGQTLVWPFDPYYEELDNLKWDRTKFMKKVRKWGEEQGAKQVKDGAGLGGYRGPGMLGGFKDNERHDPIVYQYGRLHPWSPTITQTGGEWTEYLTSKDITGQIRDVYMSLCKTGGLENAEGIEYCEPGGRRKNAVAIEHVVAKDLPAAGARDVLLAFEGGTGDKGEKDQPSSQSLMGFVLLRHWPGSEDYDVHISFRGSRSGKLARTVLQANWDKHASGNPDWITDLGFDRLKEGKVWRLITTTGEVHRGFAHSMQSILPQLFGSLSKVAEMAPRGPKRIYVTGHSLGGGLAQHFVSAVLLGDQYGPAGAGEQMPAALRGWPWKQIKLITFSAPRAGNELWAKTLTTSDRGLESEFFSTAIVPIDRKALAVLDPGILPRLTDQDHPAGYRVLISTDLVTTEKGAGGKHVGKTVYVNEPGIFASIFETPSAKAHEPVEIRKFMLESLESLKDPRIPPTAGCPLEMKDLNPDDPLISPTAWCSLKMKDLNPDWNAGERASTKELRQLADEVKRYYSENGIWFDQAAFDRNVELRFSIDGRE